MSDEVLKPRKAKSVALAMILNATPLVIFGLGYLYIGRWVRFLIVESLQLLSIIAFFEWGLRTQDFLALVWLVSVIEVLIQTLNHNQEIVKERRPGTGLLA